MAQASGEDLSRVAGVLPAAASLPDTYAVFVHGYQIHRWRLGSADKGDGPLAQIYCVADGPSPGCPQVGRVFGRLPSLFDEGRRALMVAYKCSCDFQDTAEAVSSVIQTALDVRGISLGQVVIIAHSMGGLVVTYALQDILDTAIHHAGGSEELMSLCGAPDYEVGHVRQRSGSVDSASGEPAHALSARDGGRDSPSSRSLAEEPEEDDPCVGEDDASSGDTRGRSGPRILAAGTLKIAPSAEAVSRAVEAGRSRIIGLPRAMVLLDTPFNGLSEAACLAVNRGGHLLAAQAGKNVGQAAVPISGAVGGAGVAAMGLSLAMRSARSGSFGGALIGGAVAAAGGALGLWSVLSSQARDIGGNAGKAAGLKLSTVFLKQTRIFIEPIVRPLARDNRRMLRRLRSAVVRLGCWLPVVVMQCHVPDQQQHKHTATSAKQAPGGGKGFADSATEHDVEDPEAPERMVAQAGFRDLPPREALLWEELSNSPDHLLQVVRVVPQRWRALLGTDAATDHTVDEAAMTLPVGMRSILSTSTTVEQEEEESDEEDDPAPTGDIEGAVAVVVAPDIVDLVAVVGDSSGGTQAVVGDSSGGTQAVGGDSSGGIDDDLAAASAASDAARGEVSSWGESSRHTVPVVSRSSTADDAQSGCEEVESSTLKRGRSEGSLVELAAMRAARAFASAGDEAASVELAMHLSRQEVTSTSAGIGDALMTEVLLDAPMMSMGVRRRAQAASAGIDRVVAEEGLTAESSAFAQESEEEDDGAIGQGASVRELVAAATASRTTSPMQSSSSRGSASASSTAASSIRKAASDSYASMEAWATDVVEWAVREAAAESGEQQVAPDQSFSALVRHVADHSSVFREAEQFAFVKTTLESMPLVDPSATPADLAARYAAVRDALHRAGIRIEPPKSL